MNWSTFQAAIFAAVVQILRTGHDLVVLARAGTGKTTTMVEALCRFIEANPQRSALLCAFNKRNAVELQEKIDDRGLSWKQAQAKTLNALGFATIRSAWGKTIKVDGAKGRKIAKEIAAEYDRQRKVSDPEISWANVAKLATLAKVMLIDPKHFSAMAATARRFGLIADQDEVEALVDLARAAMDAAKNQRDVVDFDDQLWFPAVFDLQPWRHDLVIVDEAQDMNASQLALARKAVKRGGRLVAVGDDRQAIYGWRGADSSFLARMVQALGADTLPLPRTYRCGHAIVAEAQAIVPDYEAADGNVNGVVEPLNRGKLVSAVDVGDFVLSRTNAPLLPIALELIRGGVPARIQGRDVMGQLIGLVERSKAETTDGLIEWLDGYERREHAKLIAGDADEGLIEALSDRCECLRALAPEHTLCRDLTAWLERVFSDRDDSEVVTLSSVHRAKGLERDRVFLLEDTFGRPGDQEDNVRYVAITRARTHLFYVS